MNTFQFGIIKIDCMKPVPESDRAYIAISMPVMDICRGIKDVKTPLSSFSMGDIQEEETE